MDLKWISLEMKNLWSLLCIKKSIQTFWEVQRDDRQTESMWAYEIPIRQFIDECHSPDTLFLQGSIRYFICYSTNMNRILFLYIEAFTQFISLQWP